MDIIFVRKCATKNSNADVNVNSNVTVEAVDDVQMSLLMNLDVTVVQLSHIPPCTVEQPLPNAPNHAQECTRVAMTYFITAIQKPSVRRALF